MTETVEHKNKLCEAEENEDLVNLVVFDFDGTSISGNSPVLLVRHLIGQHMLSKRIIMKILLWAAAYKFRLPQNESWVRRLVFSAFEGKSQAEVDRFLYNFYDEKIEKRFRVAADQAMRSHAEAGAVVLVVSATFEPIIIQAMQTHPFDYQISTRMKVDEKGSYLCEVEGNPVEGAEKLHAVTRFADTHYGEKKWRLAAAYGDHHSDRVLLSAACNAFAVTPDKPLRRTAQKEGWTILEWE